MPVVDQGYLGSCVGCAVASMHGYVRGVAQRSRLQIYYEARRLQGWQEWDTGAFIRDGVKVIATLGAGREAWWPYVETKFAEDPPLTVDRDALLRRIFTYYRLQSRTDYRKCLAQGFPFVIGFTVYDRFMNSRTALTGIVPMPVSTEKPQGGHAVTVIGYDSKFRDSVWAKDAVAQGFPLVDIPEDVYIVRNSWGVNWGHRGDFAIDARYLDLPYYASDAWTIRCP